MWIRRRAAWSSCQMKSTPISRNSRQAVADEEKKIAIAHGVDTEGDLYPCGKPTSTILSNMSCVMPVGWNYKYPDHWQFRGQWLFINVPRKETNQFSKQKTCGDTAILYVNQFGNPECVATPAPAKTTEPTKGTK